MNSKRTKLAKIVMARRLDNLSKVMERTKMCDDALLALHQQRLKLMEQLRILIGISLELCAETRLKWKLERTQSFWEEDCRGADAATFKNNFRIEKKLFNQLCELLCGLEKRDTNMREAIPLDKRIAIALYALGSSAEYRTIANMFGVGKSTVCQILLSFCAEVWRIMAPTYLNHFPLTKEKIESLVQGFEALGFPQCIGALDGCHIEIHPNSEDATDYYNYKGWYSTILLALVDARCRFIYVSSGSPGRCNDSSVFESSSLKQQLDACGHLRDMTKTFGEVDVPVLLIGDSAFRLSEKLMTPYPFHISQNDTEKQFNYKLSKCRRVVENAFGHLKARFRRIGKGIDNSVKNANSIILSCCVLHNFLNENNDHINENWLQALENEECGRTYPQHIEYMTDHANNSQTIRNAIASFLYDEGASIANCGGDMTGDIGREVTGNDGGDNGGGAQGDDDIVPEMSEFMS